LYYYSLVEEFMNTNTNYTIDDYYRLFAVGGMTHCRGGEGANSFGNQGLGYAAPYSDSTRNILMAMVDWVEKDVAPERLVATKFNGDYPPLGVNFTRPICKFPMNVVWDGQGSIWNETSFKCA
jgi:feruloyl esterase